MRSATTFPRVQRALPIILAAFFLLSAAIPALAQNSGSQPDKIAVSGFQTTAFTYQGRLSDGSTAANGLYDMQFKIFDAASNGSQLLGANPLTVERANVSVANGVFTVQLDFGSALFDGPNRYLEISVRHAGTGETYTALAPRQQITSTPYAVRSINAGSADFATNASQLAGFPATQYVKTDDERLTDARLPLAGGTSYIQNTTQQQTSADFNIGGNGTLGGTLTANTVSATSVVGDALSGTTVNATTQYNFNNQRILTATGGNMVVGIGAGHISAGAFNNAIFGNGAGASTTTGAANSFFGTDAGKANKDGSSNSFFGMGAGTANVSGLENAFYGDHSGFSNVTGHGNAFFGSNAGKNNTANINSFFGAFAGEQNSAGTDNAFFGNAAGRQNTTGNNNSFFGTGAGQFNDTGEFNSFFGKDAGMSNKANNNSFFGYSAGKSNTSGEENVFVGGFAGASNTSGIQSTYLGNGAGARTTTASRNTFVGNDAGANNVTGSYNTFLGQAAGQSMSSDNLNTFLGYQANGLPGITNSTAIGASASVTRSDSVVLGSASVNVGIGTSAPQSKLQVNGGNIYVGTAGQGIILKSPNGAVCRLLTIDNAGALSLASVSCP